MFDLARIATTLTTWWWLLLSLMFLFFIALDGADLGAGVFALFSPDEQERGAIMASMAGWWDANETWLVVAGGVLFGAFPLVYGSAFNYLMIPLMLALWGVIWRAVAFEFHVHAVGSKRFWGWAFAGGSFLAPFGAGIALGATLQGFPMKAGAAMAKGAPGLFVNSPVPHFTGTALTFLTPFSIFTGFGAVIAAGLAGGLYLSARFEKGDPINVKAQRWTTLFSYLALAAIVVTLVWSYAIFPWAAAKWTGPYWWVWALWLLVVLFFAFKSMMNHSMQRDFLALLWGEGVVVLLWFAMWATMYPYIVPETWTIQAAANPANSIAVFTLFMTGFVPIMIMYNAYQIWVFRGRTTKMASYGEH
ncbi:cytochrome d ubiquinol oxidase subunit II [Acidithiobacillus ferrooxidans]|uniref:cytochrome d ubiquinol oxidase subunit II n=1 Tax=Acidithiobacillus ferrooxidans TaxID=920 RepID=UPI000A4DFECC|nr:cytochrome d ubiquinol oxidase subunit II [Acidithiobacillus ferrooxidans]MBU2856243.1 cytochrome d ubiquinol oxidase subunit II [Acidithiobacillus ferrooxidans]MBU2861825.1 cytochrome d ubiquinol oxidase subunit II [Acidithiobacillus ferrooxidans]MCR2831088.1 cytochrome d ubiquinol oxidase subunit II [Acidithiobacillus ferrooxidans]